MPYKTIYVKVPYDRLLLLDKLRTYRCKTINIIDINITHKLYIKYVIEVLQKSKDNYITLTLVELMDKSDYILYVDKFEKEVI